MNIICENPFFKREAKFHSKKAISAIRSKKENNKINIINIFLSNKKSNKES